MDKNEVIILSSDDETNAAKDSNQDGRQSSGQFLTLSKNPDVYVKHKCENKNVKQAKDDKQCKVNHDSPEVVDLVDLLDKFDEGLSSENDQGSDVGVIDLGESSNKNNSSEEKKKLPLKETEIKQENVTKNLNIKTYTSSPETDTHEGFNQNLQFFTEFVEYCGSLEKIPEDRIRLTKKLMKRYGEADGSYIKSCEFRYLIEKCREKVNRNNLYLIAKEVSEELSYKKKVTKEGVAKDENQKDIDKTSGKTPVKLTEKRIRFINKIIKKLDKLGSKIRELEEQEVDLSDEENSTYVLLQRYRDRFSHIYKRLCAYTGQIPDPNNRKICFTESKYPAINKCIENWLNKTKRFPDFSDIMKLLESQSSTLGLPSNRELIRTLAIEIFQKVGVMLQRRRIYDLWDLFCGFLDDGKDPADSDLHLSQTLKSHFETRIKKEQEIFQHYTELQEKEKLEPEEVADDEATNSPVESGNEDDQEIAEIENNLIMRMDVAIKNGNNKEEFDENENNSENEADITTKSKETKNNYKNCKSLKWRQENNGKSKSDTSNSQDSSSDSENEKKKFQEDEEPKIDIENEDVKKDDSDLELIAVENSNVGDNEAKTEVACRTVCKRVSNMEIQGLTPKKKKHTRGDDVDIFDIDDENANTNKVFGVHCCHIYTDNVFEDINKEEKDWSKRKVFRDLTNVSRLMEMNGKRKKMSPFFSPTFFLPDFYEFEKSSWKNRFKISFKLVGKGRKCALNQEKSKKNVSSNSGSDSRKRNYNKNSEGRNDEDGNFFRSHGNGSDGDEDDDDNDENWSNSGDVNEDEFDDDEDEEETEQGQKTAEIIEDNKYPGGSNKEIMLVTIDKEEPKVEIDGTAERSVMEEVETKEGKTECRKRSIGINVKLEEEEEEERKDETPELKVQSDERKSAQDDPDIRKGMSGLEEDTGKRFSEPTFGESLSPSAGSTSKPSPAALLALATLRNIKGLSVQRKSKPQDDILIIESPTNSPETHSTYKSTTAKRRRTDTSVTSPPANNVSVSGNEDPECGYSSIKITNVWGNAHDDLTETEVLFNSSSQPPNDQREKKRSKGAIEFVVLE